MNKHEHSSTVVTQLVCSIRFSNPFVCPWHLAFPRGLQEVLFVYHLHFESVIFGTYLHHCNYINKWNQNVFTVHMYIIYIYLLHRWFCPKVTKTSRLLPPSMRFFQLFNGENGSLCEITAYLSSTSQLIWRIKHNQVSVWGLFKV